MKTLKSTLFGLLLLSCCIFSTRVQAEGYPRFYEDKDIVLQWEYDLSRKEFITVRGKLTLAIGAEIVSPLIFFISGLDSQGKRLKTESEDLGVIETHETVDFEITVPRVGQEKHMLFTYRYDIFVAESGPTKFEGWFEDSLDDPAFKPKMIKTPPAY